MKLKKIVNLASIRGNQINRNRRQFEVYLRLVLISLAILGFIGVAGCSKQAEYEIVSQQSHFPIDNKIVIRLIAQSSDQKLIATAGQDHWIRIWDSTSHDLVRILKSDSKSIHAVKFYGKDKLVVVTKARELRLYDVRSGKILFVYQDSTYRPSNANISRPSNANIRTRYGSRSRKYKIDLFKVKFSQTTRYVGIYTPDYLKIVDLKKRKVIKELDHKKARIDLFSFTWPGENLVYAIRSQKLEYFSLKTMSVLKQSKAYRVLKYPEIRDISFILNNTHMVVTGWKNRHLKIWKLTRGANIRSRSSSYSGRKLRRFFQPGRMYIDQLNDKLILHHKSGIIKVLDFKANGKVRTINLKKTVLHSVVTSHDGKKLLMASEQSGMQGHAYLVADVNTGDIHFAQNNLFTQASAFAVNSGNNILYTAHSNGSIHQWQLNTGRHISTLKTGVTGITRLYLIKGDKVLMGLAAGRKIFTYDLRSKKLLELLYLNARNLQAIGIDYTTNRMLTGHGNHCLKIWNLQNWNWMHGTKPVCAGSSSSISETVQNIIYNRGNNFTILSFGDSNIKTVSNSGKTIAKLVTHAKIKQVLLSNNGKLLAAAVHPNYLYVWSAPRLTRIHKIELKSGLKNINTLGFSKNSKQIFVGSSTGTLIAYDAKTGNEIYRHKEKSNPVQLLIQSGQKGYIVTGHADNTIRVRNSLNGHLKYIIEVLPKDQWIVYRPGKLPLVASKSANKYFRLRDKKSLRFNAELLVKKETYIEQLRFKNIPAATGK